MIRTRASAHQEERYATFLENFQHILNGWSQGLSCLLLIIILINFFNPFRSRNYHSFFCLYLKTSALSVLSCWWTPKMIRLFGYLVLYLKTFVVEEGSVKKTAIFQYHSIYRPSFTWKISAFSIFSTSWHDMKFNLHWWYPLISLVDLWHHERDHVTLFKIGFWSVNYTLDTLQKKWCYFTSFCKRLSLVQTSTLNFMWRLKFQGGVYTSPQSSCL